MLTPMKMKWDTPTESYERSNEIHESFMLSISLRLCDPSLCVSVFALWLYNIELAVSCHCTLPINVLYTLDRIHTFNRITTFTGNKRRLIFTVRWNSARIFFFSSLLLSTFFSCIIFFLSFTLLPLPSQSVFFHHHLFLLFFCSQVWTPMLITYMWLYSTQYHFSSWNQQKKE